MALSLPTDRLGQTMLLVIIVGLGGGYLYWNYLYGPKQTEIGVQTDSLAALETRIDAVRRELRTGTAEDVQRRLDVYRGSLDLLQRLVPERNEVPQLLDDLSNRAKIRAVNIVDYQPQIAQFFLSVDSTATPSPFETYMYRFEVVGRYDAIGKFLTDVASLQRVFVPEQVSLTGAADQYQRAYDDTTGALINATFMLRTYVKSGDGVGGAGGSR